MRSRGSFRHSSSPSSCREFTTPYWRLGGVTPLIGTIMTIIMSFFPGIKDLVQCYMYVHAHIDIHVHDIVNLQCTCTLIAIYGLRSSPWSCSLRYVWAGISGH